MPRHIKKMLSTCDTDSIELAGALLMLSLGVLLSLPGILSSSPAYQHLSIIPEPWLALFMTTLGVLGVITTTRGKYKHRQAMAAIAFMIWFSLAVAFARAPGASIGMVLFANFAVGAGWAYIRLSRDKYE